MRYLFATDWESLRHDCDCDCDTQTKAKRPHLNQLNSEGVQKLGLELPTPNMVAGGLLCSAQYVLKLLAGVALHAQHMARQQGPQQLTDTIYFHWCAQSLLHRQ